jgi:cytochrome c peroxidase
LRPREDFTKAFLHNGYFKTLKDVMHFYNTRDVEGANWPPPEVSANVNDAELGNLELNERNEELIVLFMKTLSDGFIPSREEK